MSRNFSNERTRLRAMSHISMSLTGYGLISPVLVRLPCWTLIIWGIFALAYGVLRVIIPQESADRLALWGYVLDRPGGVKLPIWSRSRSRGLISSASNVPRGQRNASQNQSDPCKHD